MCGCNACHEGRPHDPPDEELIKRALAHGEASLTDLTGIGDKFGKTCGAGAGEGPWPLARVPGGRHV